MTPDVVTLLRTAPLSVHGRIANASNHTTLVQIGEPDLGLLAVYKPMAGERPLWDFPAGSLHRREVAAYLVSDFLGWQVVPPTLRRDGPFGVGSVQLFIAHDPDEHYFVLVESADYDEQLARMATFDLLVNNADRKAGHVLLDDDGHVWGCDHGLTFHPHPKLRTVIWEFAGTPLPRAWRDDVARFCAALDGELGASLTALLSPREVAALGRRAAALHDLPALPNVAEEYRPYPWPPL